MTTFPRRHVFPLILVVLGASWVEPALAGSARITGAPLVYLRSGPGPGHQPVAVLSEGDSVRTIESQGSWTKIETPKGEIGFVYGSFVSDQGSMGSGIAEAAENAPQPVDPPEAGEPPPASEQAVPNPPGNEADRLVAELADLRAEIATLRGQLVRRLHEQETAAPRLRGENPVAPVNELIADADPNLRTVGTAAIGLVVGWIFGVIFSRRRSRTQRARLRF